MRKIAARKLLNSVVDAARLKILKSTPSYYIYGRGNQGFVVVSTDEETTPVLGYSSSEYIEEDMPPAFKCWLKAVEASSFRQEVSVTYQAVPNFLTTTWGQSAPFNYLCPEINDAKTPTGCVATAMGQIMYYYQHPVQGTGQGYYTLGESKNVRYPNRIDGVYQWDLIKPDYSGITVSEDERLAVATLLKDAGLAVHMNYNTDGSGAFTSDAALAFIDNFGFDANTTQYMLKEYYDKAEWSSVIYSELAARRPVLAGGYDPANGGHAFVFSGVDGDGKVYVNWGWNGNADGFYEITALNPRGILGSSNTMAFNFNNEIVYGLQPAQGKPDESLRHSLWACTEPFNAEYQKIRNWLKVKTSSIYNISIYPFTGEIKLYCESVDGDKTKDMSYTFSDYTQDVILSGYGYSDQVKTIKTTDLTPGRYYIYLVSQTTAESVPQKVRYPGGLYRYIMTKDASGVLTVESDETTGIASIVPSEKSVAKSGLYDLMGRKVNGDNLHGIYIQNGKKVVR
ncbi:MAG: C10 family peptidase [Bacteroidaceae bacterium]|nr:C10 family peptidase [Bacteroidaceae bacterium]